MRIVNTRVKEDNPQKITFEHEYTVDREEAHNRERHDKAMLAGLRKQLPHLDVLGFESLSRDDTQLLFDMATSLLGGKVHAGKYGKEFMQAVNEVLNSETWKHMKTGAAHIEQSAYLKGV